MHASEMMLAFERINPSLNGGEAWLLIRFRPDGAMFLIATPVDFRKSIDRLFDVIQYELQYSDKFEN